LELKNGQLAFKREGQKAILQKLVALKQEHPNLKIMVALGGWGGCEPCSGAFSTGKGRKDFAVSVLQLLKEYGADGIDLDWEYPTIAGYPGHPYSQEDYDHFTELLKVLRKTLGKNYEISFAAGGFTRFVEQAVNWKKVMKWVDRVNLMTYDLVGGFSKVTGHHTPLYSSTKQKESADNCIQLLRQKNFPIEKLVLGAAFYARTWKDVSSVNDGIYQSGVFESFVPYRKHADAFTSSHGFKKYFDNDTKASWSYSEQQRVFATYDDDRSIEAKVDYVKKNNMGGIMFWELTLDRPQQGLLGVLLKSLQNGSN
jgi:chitinase